MQRTTFMDSRADTIEQIDKLKDSARFNWDSYEAQEVGLREREQAKACVRAVGEAFGPPLVSPIADPGVALIWKRKGFGEVDALFTPHGASYVVIGDDRKFVTKGAISNFDRFARDVLTQYLKK